MGRSEAVRFPARLLRSRPAAFGQLWSRQRGVLNDWLGGYLPFGFRASNERSRRSTLDGLSLRPMCRLREKLSEKLAAITNPWPPHKLSARPGGSRSSADQHPDSERLSIEANSMGMPKAAHTHTPAGHLSSGYHLPSVQPRRRGPRGRPGSPPGVARRGRPNRPARAGREWPWRRRRRWAGTPS